MMQKHKAMTEWYMFGEIRQTERITVEDITEVMEKARSLTGQIREVPIIYIIDILDRVGRIFTDVESPFCKEVTETMHRQLGWSEAMVKEGLLTISDILTQEHLSARL